VLSLDPNKLNHIFENVGQITDRVAAEFGSQSEAFGALQRATESAARTQGINGVFATTVQVGGESIVVRDNVVNGAVKIGTAFKP
jgi:hypothetical protein